MGTARIQPRGVASITAIFASISNRISTLSSEPVFAPAYCWRMTIFLSAQIKPDRAIGVAKPLPRSFRRDNCPRGLIPPTNGKQRTTEKRRSHQNPCRSHFEAIPIPFIGVVRFAKSTPTSFPPMRCCGSKAFCYTRISVVGLRQWAKAHFFIGIWV